MSERFLVDVGAQYTGDPRIAVLEIGTDDDGTYAAVVVGSHPHATDVRLRVGQPHALGDGRTLHLAAVSPEGYRPSAALMVTDAEPGGAR